MFVCTGNPDFSIVLSNPAGGTTYSYKTTKMLLTNWLDIKMEGASGFPDLSGTIMRKKTKQNRIWMFGQQGPPKLLAKRLKQNGCQYGKENKIHINIQCSFCLILRWKKWSCGHGCQLWSRYQRVGRCWITYCTPSPIVPLSPLPPTQSMSTLNSVVPNRTDINELFSLACELYKSLKKNLNSSMYHCA